MRTRRATCLLRDSGGLFNPAVSSMAVLLILMTAVSMAIGPAPAWLSIVAIGLIALGTAVVAIEQIRFQRLRREESERRSRRE